jgi:hypothetical protein
MASIKSLERHYKIPNNSRKYAYFFLNCTSESHYRLYGIKIRILFYVNENKKRCTYIHMFIVETENSTIKEKQSKSNPENLQNIASIASPM